jgi:hypothetical protein
LQSNINECGVKYMSEFDSLQKLLMVFEGSENEFSESPPAYLKMRLK